MSNAPLPGQADAEKKYGNKLPPAVAAQVAATEALYNAPPPVTDGGTPAAESSSSPQPGQPEVHAPAATPPAGGDVDWEQRARSAEGRLSAAQQQLNAQNERLDQMDRTLASMTAQGLMSPKDGQSTARPFTPLVTEEETRDYGTDLIDVVGRRAKEVLLPEIETVQQRLDRLEGRVNGVSTVIQRDATQSVYETLAQHVGPNWNDLNHHPDFKDRWLGQRDPYSGKILRDLLKEAFDRQDGPRVLSFFQGYLTEATGSPSPSQPAPSPAPQNGAGEDPLMRYAAPGRARSEPPTPLGKPVYSRAQLNQFWEAKRRGAYKGREPEADAIERDIFQAQHEGRIV
jgi:hypothetical protein